MPILVEDNIREFLSEKFDLEGFPNERYSLIRFSSNC